MVKKLRYYARFIVVCLLLPKLDVIVDLIKVSCIVTTVDDYFSLTVMSGDVEVCGGVCKEI